MKIVELKKEVKEKNFIIKSLTQKIKSLVKDFDYNGFIDKCKSKVDKIEKLFC